MRNKKTTLALLAALLVSFAIPAMADGTEVLGPPIGLEIQEGSGIVAAGTGTVPIGSTNYIDIEVPAGATVKQVLLYWAGETRAPNPGDDTITVNGNEIVGALIGGPTFFFTFDGEVDYSAFRADITELMLVGAGSSMLTIEDMAFAQFNNGAGALVIYDDGTGLSRIDIRDGVDLAFAFFPEPRKTTIPQTFDIGPAAVERTADLRLFAGSVGELDRPNQIKITVGMDVTTLINPLGSLDGQFWDTITIPVTIPIGASTVTVEPISWDDPTGNLPASLSWIGAAFAIPLYCGDGIVDEGEECDDGNDNDFDECRNDCTLPYCGDGIVDEGEECDDGNDNDFDECRNDCTRPTCGDDVIDWDLGETCDPPGSPAGDDVCRDDCTYCGDGILDDQHGEECDDGNNEAGDGCDPTCMTEEDGGEGCTPGYWKGPHHFVDWSGYGTGDSYSTVFGVSPSFGDITLLAALRQGGGGEMALGRHAVAALLNAADSDVAYAYTETEVIAIVQDAYASGDFTGAKDALEAENDPTPCPLGKGRGRPDEASSDRLNRFQSATKGGDVVSIDRR